MRSSEPPTVATWLLRQFGCSPQNEAILGDLVEQYRDGRSGLWYWLQALVAIALGVVRAAYQDKVRTLAAIGTAWIVLRFYEYILVRQVFYYIEQAHPNLALAQYVFSKILPRNWITYYLWVFPVATDFVWVLLFSIAGFFTGWLIARFHSSPGRRAYCYSQHRYARIRSLFLCVRFSSGGGLE